MISNNLTAPLLQQDHSSVSDKKTNEGKTPEGLDFSRLNTAGSTPTARGGAASRAINSSPSVQRLTGAASSSIEPLPMQRLSLSNQKNIPNLGETDFAVYSRHHQLNGQGIRTTHALPPDADLLIAGEKANHWKKLFARTDHLEKRLKDTATSLKMKIELGAGNTHENTTNMLLVLDQFAQRRVDLSGIEVRRTDGGQYIIDTRAQGRSSYICFRERILYIAAEISELDFREAITRLLIHMCNFKNSEDTMVMIPANEESQAWIAELAGGRERGISDICSIIAAHCIKTGKPIIDEFDAQTLKRYKQLGGPDLFPNMGTRVKSSAAMV